jgi:hypothetical protein
MLWIERPAVTAIADIFPCFTGCRPRIVTLFGHSGCGKTAGVLEIARRARLNGFVPVDIDIVHARSHVAALIGALVKRFTGVRLIFDFRGFLADEYVDSGNWRANGMNSSPILRQSSCVLASMRAWRCLVCTVPRGVCAQIARAPPPRRAPGAIARLLWRNNGSPLWTKSVVSARASRVAEQPLVYGTEEPSPIAGERSRARVRWPAPGEISRLLQRVEAARALIKCGRHAPGARQLRQAVGGLARRGDWTHAAAGALELASARGLEAGGRSRARGRAFRVRIGRNEGAHSMPRYCTIWPSTVPGSMRLRRSPRPP